MTTSIVTKLNRSPLYEQAYRALLRMILDGVLPPGQRLTEKYLAELLGVSSTPVREAIRKLEHEGLLQSNGNAVQITLLQADDIEQLYVCREALETLAIEIAAGRLTDVDLQELEAALEAAEIAANEEDFLRLVEFNTAFHDRFIRATGNPWLMSSVGFVRRPLLLARIQVTLDKAESRRVLSDHRAILQALKQHDRKAAIEALRKHMRADRERMLRGLSETETELQA